MKRCNVNSYDLHRASDLARQLQHPVLTDQAATLGEPIRLPAQTMAAPPQNLVVDLHALPLELDSWEVFLAWSLELCRARAGFVVDPQGFVVATRGNVPTDHFDGLGAELAYAMEQLDRIDADAGSLLSIELQFASRRLMAMRVSKEKDGCFVIGYVGSRPLGDEIRNVIAKQVAHSLNRLI